MVRIQERTEIDAAAGRLVQTAAHLDIDVRTVLARVREALTRPGKLPGERVADAELEFDVLLRRLDALNEQAGDCLAAIQEAI